MDAIPDDIYCGKCGRQIYDESAAVRNIDGFLLHPACATKPLCANCNKRPGTLTWTGTEGVMLIIHGGGQQWCEVCVLRAQIEHAKERAAELPKLEARLVEVSKAQEPGTMCELCGLEVGTQHDWEGYGVGHAVEGKCYYWREPIRGSDRDGRGWMGKYCEPKGGWRPAYLSALAKITRLEQELAEANGRLALNILAHGNGGKHAAGTVDPDGPMGAHVPMNEGGEVRRVPTFKDFDEHDVCRLCHRAMGAHDGRTGQCPSKGDSK